MRSDLSWTAETVLASAPFLPAGKGALILALGGLAMLAITAVLSRAIAGPPPEPVPDRTQHPSTPRRDTGGARAAPSSRGRVKGVRRPKPAKGRTSRTSVAPYTPPPTRAPRSSRGDR